LQNTKIPIKKRLNIYKSGLPKVAAAKKHTAGRAYISPRLMREIHPVGARIKMIMLKMYATKNPQPMVSSVAGLICSSIC